MSHNNKSILIPVDFSERSIDAIKHSYEFVKSENASILLVNVQIKKTNEIKVVQDKLEKLASEIKAESGLDVEYKILFGSKVANLLLKLIKEITPKYIIIGLEKRDDHNEFISSMTFRIISRSNTPVICINRDQNTNFKKILLPIDLSKSSRQKVPRVVPIAMHYNAEVDILLVLEENHPLNKQKLTLYGNQVHDMLTKKKIKCTLNLVTGGKYDKMITDHAKKTNTDLIIIMTQSEYTYMELFVDKTAMHIINGTDTPVLSLRPLKIEGRTYF